MTAADPLVVTDTGTLAVAEPGGVLTIPDTTRTVTEYIASHLTGLHRIAGRFVYLTATVGDDGHLTCDLQRVRFGGDDSAVRMVLIAAPLVEIPPSASYEP